ncbi:MAG TPA: hypothetical protein VFO17_05940 [Acidimicrobiia bacterium]|jgi:hypothetical protein|nr:hypothetical protein [Acidimicrobiia bacterium]
MATTPQRSVRPDLSALWLPLLRDLTERFPGWTVWKNPESAFDGPGDIDSLAPREQWDSIERVFKTWAKDNGFRPTIVCRHVPQGPHFITVVHPWPHMLILDVKELSTWRGSTLIDHRRAGQVSEVGHDGFRRIRPGAEGVAKLLLNGVLPGGRKNEKGLEAKRVQTLLVSDPEGAELALGWVGPVSGTLRRGIDAYLGGGWDRQAMLTIEVFCTLRSLGEPRTAVSRLRFKRAIKQCDILQSVRKRHRAIPDDAQQWYREISVNHEVDLDPSD